MKLNKKILYSVLFAVILFVFVASTASAADLCTFLDNAKEKLLWIGGTLCVVGFVVAGILYLISGGSPEKTGVARKAIIAAVIGTALVIMATSAFEIVNDLLDGDDPGSCYNANSFNV